MDTLQEGADFPLTTSVISIQSAITMKEKRDLFLWMLIALMFITSAFVYDLYAYTDNRNFRLFGVTYMTMNNPFYSVIQNELVKSIQNKGDSLVLRDPMLDPEKQIQQIEEFIEMKVDGIFINPVDSIQIAESLEKATNQGIPIIVIDCPLDSSSEIVSAVYSDNYQAGVLWAQDLVHKYDGGKIALIKHSSTISGQDRIQGFKDSIAYFDQFEIVNEAESDGQTEIAMPAVLDMLAETPDINFIMCLNDPSAMGAIAALEYANRPDIRVYGVDGTPDFKEQLTRDSVAEATVMQSPYTMAAYAANSMYSFLEGVEVQSTIIIPVELLDRSNIEKQNLREWQ